MSWHIPSASFLITRETVHGIWLPHLSHRESDGRYYSLSDSEEETSNGEEFVPQRARHTLVTSVVHLASNELNSHCWGGLGNLYITNDIFSTGKWGPRGPLSNQLSWHEFNMYRVPTVCQAPCQALSTHVTATDHLRGELSVLWEAWDCLSPPPMC